MDLFTKKIDNEYFGLSQSDLLIHEILKPLIILFSIKIIINIFINNIYYLVPL